MADSSFTATSDPIGRLYGGASKEGVKAVTPACRPRNIRPQSSQQRTIIGRQQPQETRKAPPYRLKDRSRSAEQLLQGSDVKPTQLPVPANAIQSKESLGSKSKETREKKEYVQEIETGLTTNQLERLAYKMGGGQRPSGAPVAKSTIKRAMMPANDGKPRFANQVAFLVTNAFLFSFELVLVDVVIISEVSYVYIPYPSTLAAAAAIITGLLDALCLGSITFEFVRFIVNQIRMRRYKPLLKAKAAKISLQMAKTVLVFVNLAVILLWSDYHGILSLDMDTTSLEDLEKIQKFEKNSIRIVVMTLLQLLLLLLVETYLISFGPSIAAKTGQKKKN